MSAYLYSIFLTMGFGLSHVMNVWKGGDNCVQKLALAGEDPPHKKAHRYRLPIPGKDSSVVLVDLPMPARASCKFRHQESIHFPFRMDGMAAPKVMKTPVITFHGNISYDYDYRSQLDTPFSGTNFQQHHEQIYADAVWKGKYPFRLITDARQSNSPYFKNYFHANIQFNHQAFQQNTKQQLLEAYERKLQSLSNAASYEQQIKQDMSNVNSTEAWINNPARRQELLQQKELQFNQYLTDTVGKTASQKDSLRSVLDQPTQLEAELSAEQKRVDSLRRDMDSTRKEADSVAKAMQSDLNVFSTKVQNANSLSELDSLQKESGAKPMSGTDKALMSFTQLGVGKCALNYSDLTVNNVTINGVNIEYNPSMYAAFAAGTVDYLFQDFVLNPGQWPKQKLVLGRFGWGNKNRQAWILTVYNGTKEKMGGLVQDTASNIPVTQTIHVFGYSLETIYKLAKNMSISGEWAKSTTPSTNNTPGDGSGHAFTFSDHSNEAWSLKYNTEIPQWQSSISAFYRLIGANFQSYSIFNSGSQQVQWGIRWQQYLLNKQLSLIAQVKKSSYDDPLLAAQYSTSALMESFQATWHKNKWPVISVAYMPSTQLLKASDGSITETMYYTLTGTVMYSYSFHRINMNTSLLYSRFFNKGTDSGFVAYDAQNIILTHAMNWWIWNSQSQVQYTEQPGLIYWIFTQNLGVNIGKKVTLGAGISDYRVTQPKQDFLGENYQLGLNVGKCGMFRLQYSKAYIANSTGGLSPFNWGRATWVKIF